MKYLILSALLLTCPVSFPSKWGMSLDASQSKEANALRKCLKSSEKEFREEVFQSLLFLYKYERHLEHEIELLQQEIYDLQNELHLMKIGK